MFGDVDVLPMRSSAARAALDFRRTITPKAYTLNQPRSQPFSAGAELSSNGLLLRRWLRSSRGVAPKKLR
ncbi:hypothetical protein GLGCALEP_04854 [Pseudomonas sp. MM221]|nr:hypothetical protein DBADOPDK_04735 [Pseudomonas sp. MM223]CAI3808161.1 hypothetical protein GLGCALEP_04854 [Pseudomonas sp. MM221]